VEAAECFVAQLSVTISKVLANPFDYRGVVNYMLNIGRAARCLSE
jgi:hypothetical protein